MSTDARRRAVLTAALGFLQLREPPPDLEARGKGPETIGRAAETAKAVERLMDPKLRRR